MKLPFLRIRFLLLQTFLLLSIAGTAFAQFFVVSNSLSGNCAILEYDFNGTYMNTIPVPMGDIRGLAISGTNLFVASFANGTIGKFTTSGEMVNPALISGLTGPYAMAISGTNLFVGSSQYIGKYTTSGTTINAQLIVVSSTLGMTIIGTNIFAANYNSGTIGEYTLDGATVNATLITGLSSPRGLATDGTYLYVANSGNGTIGLYTTSGGGGAFLYGVNGVELTISGTNMYVVTGSTIGKYTTSGSTVNASLVTGGHWFWGIAASSITQASPPPAIGITTYSNQPVVIWPATANTYVLQTTTNLASGNWVTVSNYLPMAGAMITNASSPAFFRLH